MHVTKLLFITLFLNLLWVLHLDTETLMVFVFVGLLKLYYTLPRVSLSRCRVPSSAKYCTIAESHPRLRGKSLPPIHVVLASNSTDFIIK